MECWVSCEKKNNEKVVVNKTYKSVKEAKKYHDMKNCEYSLYKKDGSFHRGYFFDKEK